MESVQNVFKMITVRSGKAFKANDWTEMELKVLKADREFKRKAGFSNQDDRLPKMFYEESLQPHNKVVVIIDEEMDTTFDFLLN